MGYFKCVWEPNLVLLMKEASYEAEEAVPCKGNMSKCPKVQMYKDLLEVNAGH